MHLEDGRAIDLSFGTAPATDTDESASVYEFPPLGEGSSIAVRAMLLVTDAAANNEEERMSKKNIFWAALNVRPVSRFAGCL